MSSGASFSRNWIEQKQQEWKINEQLYLLDWIRMESPDHSFPLPLHENPAFSNFYHFYPEYRFLSQSASQVKILMNPASRASSGQIPPSQLLSQQTSFLKYDPGNRLSFWGKNVVCTNR